MSLLETALAGWLLFISNLGVDLEPQLLPPASRAELAQLEEVIGYSLPEDYIQLYLIANGQQDTGQQGGQFTATFCPLFGYYEFMNLEQVLADYEQHLVWYQEELPDYFEADVRQGDPVAGVAWQPGWVPFAVSNAANYAVDLSPPRGGTYGQVIEYGHDTVENRVMAGSISEFLTLASENLDPEEPYRYQYDPANPDELGGSSYATLFFDMDWQQTPEAPHSHTAMPQDPVMLAWNEAHHAAVSEFLLWLADQGYSDDEQATFRQWLFAPTVPSGYRLLAPPLPEEQQLAHRQDDFQYTLIDLEFALQGPTGFIEEALPVTLEEAFALVYRYFVETGHWSEKRFDAAIQVINRERPARYSIMDENAPAHSSAHSIIEQDDGTLLLCHLEMPGIDIDYSKCIAFPEVD